VAIPGLPRNPAARQAAQLRHRSAEGGRSPEDRQRRTVSRVVHWMGRRTALFRYGLVVVLPGSYTLVPLLGRWH
jgi:hypothetical protein